MLQELRDPNRYFSVLEAIAGGKTRMNEIAQASGIATSSITFYLNTLQENAQTGEFRTLEYLYPKLGSDVPVLKMGTSMLVPEANLWVGTGLYIDSIATDQAAISTEIQQITDRTVRILLLIVVLELVIAFGFIWYVIRKLTRPIQEVVSVAYAIAEGYLDKEITIRRSDEIGQLAVAFGSMLAYLRNTATVANHIANGDLTANAQPRSEQDALGKALQVMVQRLRDLIGNVRANADSVTAAGHRLNLAAEQSGLATQPIAQTITQVALGNSQLSQNVEQTRRIIEEQNHAIDSIAGGARGQAQAVEKANRTLNKRLTVAIDQVRIATDQSGRIVDETGQATENGAAAVARTVKGMQAIVKANRQVSDRVLAMGDRSQEIGKIVSTIDAIAERTNLLALNAAIEAARAGEHGKGFAVVADEVRKLAEQSTRSTQEIAALIQTVQQTAEQAVTAMNESNQQVEMGLSTADETEQALEQIRTRVTQVTKQMQGLTAAVVEMSSGRQEMEAIMTEVAEIVETNSTAAEQLTGSSEQVLEAMAEVSAVSEQNSAAAEQVSASAQEVSIQVEETASSAESLTDMAQALQQVVAQFRLDVRASKHEETNNGVTGYIGFSSGTNGYNSADKDEQDVALYELPVSA